MQRVLTDISGVVAAQTERGEKTKESPFGENYITTLLGDLDEPVFTTERDRIVQRRAALLNQLQLSSLAIPLEYVSHAIQLIDGQTNTEPDEDLRPPFVADALWTMTPGIGLAVSTADCGGILVADSTQPLVAAIHSGHAQSVRALPYRTIKQLPANPKNLKVYVSPLADVYSYEVSADFRGNFIDYFKRHFTSLGLDPADYFAEQELNVWTSREHKSPVVKIGTGFDNRRLILDQLLAAGILEANITVDQRNTMNPTQNLHSYRLDGYVRDEDAEMIARSPSGAQLSTIGISADA